ncbi:MAG: LolA family protein [Bacteroidales bacterium]
MIKSLFTLFFSLSVSLLFAQQSDSEALKVLDKAASQYNKAKGVYIAFELTTENKRTKAVQQVNGTIQMKGIKSYLKTEDAEVWYDGKNQWSYYHESSEVNLSNPGPTEMEVYNPAILFRNYKKSFVVTYVGQKSYGGVPYEVVELRPVEGNNNLIKITCRFTLAGELNSVLVQNRNLTEARLFITTYQTGKTYDDSLFVFPATTYPDVEVIDLR